MGYKQYRSEPLTEPEKRYLRRKNGVKARHSVASGPAPIDAPKERDYIAPIKPDWKPARKRLGGSGCRLSPEKRAMVQRKQQARRAFFAELGVKV